MITNKITKLEAFLTKQMINNKITKLEAFLTKQMINKDNHTEYIDNAGQESNVKLDYYADGSTQKAR